MLKAIREAIILLAILFTFYSSPELLYPCSHISNWWNQNDMISAIYPLATFNSFGHIHFPLTRFCLLKYLE